MDSHTQQQGQTGRLTLGGPASTTLHPSCPLSVCPEKSPLCKDGCDLRAVHLIFLFTSLSHTHARLRLPVLRPNTLNRKLRKQQKVQQIALGNIHLGQKKILDKTLNHKLIHGSSSKCQTDFPPWQIDVLEYRRHYWMNCDYTALLTPRCIATAQPGKLS